MREVASQADGRLTRAVVDHVGAAIAATDRDGIVVFWNHAASTLYGWSADDVVGLHLADFSVVPDDRPLALRIIEQVGAGAPWEGEIPIRRNDGTSILAFAVVTPVLDDHGKVTGLVAVSVDVTERHSADAERAILLGRERAARAEAEEARLAAERAAERAARLQSVTAALSEALTVGQVHRVVVEVGIAAVGGSAGVVGVLTESGAAMDIVASVGYRQETLDRWQGLDLTAVDPLPYAVRTAEPVWVGSAAELTARYPRFPQAPETKAFVALPLVAGGRVLGGLGIGFDEQRTFDDDDRTFLLTLVQYCAQALDRARLFEMEQASQRRAAFLAEATELLASSLDHRTNLARVAALGLPQLADWCAVHVLDDLQQPKLLAAAHVDRSKADLIQAWQERFPPDRTTSRGIGKAIRGGQVEFAPFVADPLEAGFARDAEEAALLCEIGFGALVVVPLTLRGRTLGSLALGGATADGRLRLADLSLVEDLAGRMATAIENARLYAERSEVARTLQESLLPPNLPSVPGVDVAVRYRAAGQGNEVGGDFYDLFDTGDAGWAVVMGDVCGKGPEAAAVTGLARHTIRAVAMQERGPSRILARLNDALLRQGTDRFCTVCYVRLQLTPNGARLMVGCAGHPLPLVLRADGTVEPAGRPGMPVGLFEEPLVYDVSVDLAAGDALVLYTDGVTERHEGRRIFGDDGLRRALKAVSGQPAATVALHLEDAVVDFQSGPLRDDMAVLVVRIVP